jgi:hypothetical protein
MGGHSIPKINRHLSQISHKEHNKEKEWNQIDERERERERKPQPTTDRESNGSEKVYAHYHSMEIENKSAEVKSFCTVSTYSPKLLSLTSHANL